MKKVFSIFLILLFASNLRATDLEGSSSLRKIADSMKYENALGFYKLKKYKRALEGFREYLEVWHNGSYRESAYQHIAKIYMRDFRYDRAMKVYDKMFREFRNEEGGIEAYYKSGICCLKMGYDERARAIFTEILSMAPGSRAAVNAEIQLELLKISSE